MCPGTLAVIALTAKVGGDILKGVGQARSDAYNAQVARNNATIERQNAGYSASATAADTEKAGLEARAKLASVRAAGAANNLDVNSGSAADVQTSQRMLGGLDQATVASRGALQVYGYQSKATSYQAQANLDQAKVIPDYIGAGLNVVGDVAGGIPNLPSGGGGGGGSVSPSLIESGPDVPSNYSWMTSFSDPGISNAVPEFG